MNLIREVKERADIVKVAELYGLKLNRANKCKCLWHKEKTASLSFSQSKQIFKCFGCGKGGDVISLVSELLNVNALESAKSINEKLSLGIDIGQKTTYFEINKYKTKRDVEKVFREWENKTLQLLCDYYHLLNDWKELKDPEKELYVEALQQLDYINYVIDEIFLNGTNEDKIWFWKYEKKVVKRIESRVRTFRAINE